HHDTNNTNQRTDPDSTYWWYRLLPSSCTLAAVMGLSDAPPLSRLTNFIAVTDSCFSLFFRTAIILARRKNYWRGHWLGVPGWHVLALPISGDRTVPI